MATALLNLPVAPRRPPADTMAARGPARSPAPGLFEVLRAADPGRPDVPPLLRVRRLAEGATLQLQGARADALHIVRSGGFKCVHMLEDGYEQVVRLAERGEVLGFDGLCHGEHPTSAIALEDSTVWVLPVHELDAMPVRAPQLERALRSAVSRELGHAARMADMMSAVASETRIARFLVWMSDRAAERGESPRRLRLRLGRRDIASLLGVAHETVSRSLTTLVRAGVLTVDNRDIEIRDGEALLTVARGTRRGAPDGTPRQAAAGLRS